VDEVANGKYQDFVQSQAGLYQTASLGPVQQNTKIKFEGWWLLDASSTTGRPERWELEVFKFPH
jgi:hypothetical protein